MNLKLKLAIRNIFRQKQTTSISMVGLVVAFVIASPTAYFIINKGFENFAYKTELSIWIFAPAGVLALGIVLLRVSFQLLKAATKNPIENLRYEYKYLVSWSRLRRVRAARRNPVDTLRYE